MFRGAFETPSTSIIPPASSNTLSYMVEGPMGCFTLASIDRLVLQAVGVNGFFVGFYSDLYGVPLLHTGTAPRQSQAPGHLSEKRLL